MRVSLLFIFFLLLQPIQVSAQKLDRLFEDVKKELLYQLGDTETLYQQRQYGRAYRAYKPKAENGNAHAQFRLYEMFRMGRGVPRNSRQARQWLDKSVSQNYGLALVELSRIYYETWFGLQGSIDSIKSLGYGADNAWGFYYSLRAVEVGYFGNFCAMARVIGGENFIYKDSLNGNSKKISRIHEVAGGCLWGEGDSWKEGLSDQEIYDIEDAALICYESRFKNCGLPPASAFLAGIRLRDADIEMDKQLSQIAPADKGWIGAQLEWSNETKLTRVQHVISEGPAHEAKIQSGDNIAAINGEKPNSFIHLLYMLAKQKPGTIFQVELVRKDEVVVLDVTSGNFDAFAKPVVEDLGVENAKARQLIYEASIKGITPTELYREETEALARMQQAEKEEEKFQGYIATIRPTSSSIDISKIVGNACNFFTGISKPEVSFTIEKTGAVTNVKTLEWVSFKVNDNYNYGVWKAARDIAEGYKFAPVIRHGEPVRVENVKRTYTFNCGRDSSSLNIR
jgi:hypothetical protein